MLVVPARGADPGAFREAIEEVVALVERSPDAGRPVPASGPPLRWPPAGVDYEARAARGGSLLKRRSVVLALTLWAYVVMRFGIKVGNFVPKIYLQQVVENSDFRKYDDGLRMILDCTPELAEALAQRLGEAAANGVVRYGLHRQDAAMMTCFTPSVMRSDHVHFIDGARGGHASAATALKAMVAYSLPFRSSSADIRMADRSAPRMTNSPWTDEIFRASSPAPERSRGRTCCRFSIILSLLFEQKQEKNWRPLIDLFSNQRGLACSAPL